MKRVWAAGAFLLLLAPLPVRAQTPDSAAIYAAMVARHPDDSRAVFRLAALQPRGSARAIELYTRYAALEPNDAWGHLALAEALAAARQYGAALQHIKRAEQLAPGNEDVAVVRRRVQRANRNAAPTAQPRVSLTRDTDRNQLTQFAFAGDIAAGATGRLGASVTHATTGDGVESFTADEGRAQYQARTAGTRFEASGGVAHVNAATAFNTAVGRMRLRVNPGPDAVLLDVRASRAPLLVSPLLMVNQVVLSEARATLELPLGHTLRLRGNGQIGDLASADLDTITFQQQMGHGRRTTTGTRSAVVSAQSHNRRIGLGGALVARIGKTAELSANYYQLSYDKSATAGYFAPRLVQLAEVGTYSEIYRFDPVVIAFDLGAGVQRSAEQGGVPGDWTPALRGWGQLTVPLAHALELNLETDYYKSQLSTVTTSGSWSSFTGAVSFRWLIGY